jgi:hypothetical protein
VAAVTGFGVFCPVPDRGRGKQPRSWCGPRLAGADLRFVMCEARATQLYDDISSANCVSV